jgi:hypothetical protein
MQCKFIGAATVAALGLGSFSAHAGCSDPRTPAQQDVFKFTPGLMLMAPMGESHSKGGKAADDIVGTWHVTYTVEGSPFAEAFIQWHNDGTEWENANVPTLGGNICMGSWKPVDRRHVSRNHIGWLFENGFVSGYFTETETDEVAGDGNSYHGVNDQKIYDLNGKLQAEVTGTASATRISP